MKMPSWTVITNHPDSWPGDFTEDDEFWEHEVVARFPERDGWGSLEAFLWDSDVCIHILAGDRIGYIGGVWRYADNYDYPPLTKLQELKASVKGLQESVRLVNEGSALFDDDGNRVEEQK